MSHHASPLCRGWEPRSLSGLLRSSATRDGPSASRLPCPQPGAPAAPPCLVQAAQGPGDAPGWPPSLTGMNSAGRTHGSKASSQPWAGRGGCSQEKRVEQRQFRGLGLRVTGSLRATCLLTLNPGSAHDMRGLALFFLEAKVPWQESLPLVSRLWAPWQPQERF